MVYVMQLIHINELRRKERRKDFMRSLSGKERLLRVFRQQLTDRMPFWIWDVDPMFPSDRSSWKPLYEWVEKYELDIMRFWHPKFESVVEQPTVHLREKLQSSKSGMWEYKSVISTPIGDLTQVYYQPKDGSPGYVKEYFVESVEDAKKWLSIPPRIIKPEVASYFELQNKTGNRTMLIVSIGEAMYSIHWMIGSETFGFWLREERSLLHEMIDRSYANIENLVKYLLSHDVGDCYGWVGPELCIPPLASPEDFREFVFNYDRRIIDLVHNSEKVVWLHCHGDMKPVLSDFVEMGVDCLNPIEPPPVGGLTLKEAKELVNGRMTLDGGFENNNFDTLEVEEVEKLVEETVAVCKPGGCYIFSETGTPGTWPILTEKHIANYRVFIETGVRLASYN